MKSKGLFSSAPGGGAAVPAVDTDMMTAFLWIPLRPTLALMRLWMAASTTLCTCSLPGPCRVCSQRRNTTPALNLHAHTHTHTHTHTTSMTSELLLLANEDPVTQWSKGIVQQLYEPLKMRGTVMDQD